MILMPFLVKSAEGSKIYSIATIFKQNYDLKLYLLQLHPIAL